MAVVDYFIKFDGIKGESADSKHKDEIDVESWSWGMTQSGSASAGGGAGAGKVSMQDFHFVMTLSKASPGLMQSLASGKHIASAVLTARKAGKTQAEYLTFKFTDILVSSYQTGGSSASDTVPLDQISFNFAKIEMEYKEQKADGSLTPGGSFKFDLKANKSF
jgi:type VI secretion system secreted protein Hcp